MQSSMLRRDNAGAKLFEIALCALTALLCQLHELRLISPIEFRFGSALQGSSATLQVNSTAFQHGNGIKVIATQDFAHKLEGGGVQPFARGFGKCGKHCVNHRDHLHDRLLVEIVGPKVLCLGRTELGRSQTFGRQRRQRIGGGTIIKNMARQGMRCGVFCHECTARTDFLVFAVDNGNQKPSCFLECQPFMRHRIE